MDTSALDSSLANRMGVACRSPLNPWPSPPAAHAHHSGGILSGSSSSNNNNNNNNNNSGNSNNNNYMGFTSSASDNENSNSIMSDCQSNISGVTSTSNNNNNGSSGGSSNSHSNNSNSKQNQVGTIMLHGVAIVSLVIDNKCHHHEHHHPHPHDHLQERLCLAQISNTLLKDYSYNEIHNRRVALGITCVQCTPVQLEILRRAGAMPVSSRRCGMITKREAERLVKSFLEENTPPKLPDDFAFDVHHECGWGCRGFFEPSRYNSSRAKCIKCSYCNMYFSPNKFIFHFHRTPGSKYNHPDAANFNSWRRHLKLFSGHDNEEIVYKWEDVKAMFNGGTRKRVFTSSSSSSSTTSSLTSSSISSSSHPSSGNYSGRSQSHSSDGSSVPKKAKTAPNMESNPYIPKPPPFPNPFNPYNWLTAAAAPGKTPYPFMSMNSSQSMCFGFPPQGNPNKDALADRMKNNPMAPASWMGRSAPGTGPFSFSSMDLFWDKAFGFPQAAALGFRNSGYPSPALPGSAAAHSAAVTAALMDNPDHLSPQGDAAAPCLSPPQHNVAQNLIKSSFERGEKIPDRMSAFKRVVPASSTSPPSSLSPPHSTQDDAEAAIGHLSNDYHPDDDVDDDDDDNDDDSMCAQDLTTSHKDMDDCEEIDVEEEGDERKRKGNVDTEAEEEGDDDTLNVDGEKVEKNEENNDSEELLGGVSQDKSDQEQEKAGENCDEKPKIEEETETEAGEAPSSPARPSSAHSPGNSGNQNNDNSAEPGAQDSGLSDESDTEAENQKTFVDMSKEELCQTLKSEVESRRRREKEVNVLKETFREEVNREKSFREHMAQQLEMLRETLTNELEQERKIRFSLQQKLKEAHDALQNFSCGLLTGRRDSFSLKDAAVVPR